jgi:hypothetical protein
MDGITSDELRARLEQLTRERLACQREAQDRDLGFAYAMGEIEQLLQLLAARTMEGTET